MTTWRKMMNMADLESFDGLIFDLDGTLINSMPIHNKAWVQAVLSHGHELDQRVLAQWVGISTFETVKILNAEFGWHLDPTQVTLLKEKLYADNVSNVQLADQVVEVARQYQDSKKLAIVTGGERAIVTPILKSHKLERLFPVVVCADDTQRGKQYPDPFLLAAQMLDVVPSKCIVFDDGEVGLAGAKAAGMATVKVDLESEFPFLV